MNERAIFEAALEIADSAARWKFLDDACRESPDARTRIERLLKSHETAGEFPGIAAIEQIQGQSDNPAEKTIVCDPQASDVDDDDVEMDLSFLQPSTRAGSIGTLGHYEILQVLGHGGFGTVFKGFDEKLHRHVAIKVMNPQLAATSPPRKRFLREARSAAAIKHENIVQVYSVEEQPLPYLVMEYIGGPTLQQLLDEKGPLEAIEILYLGRQIARGLAAAHALGLIHRDIKPGNILLEPGAEQKVKITDFGLARAVDDASMTRTGVVSGTPMYMAPEQALGQALDHRADLFSFGSVLYQMACGRAPFRASTSVAVLRRVVEDTPRPMQEILSEIPEWLVDIVNTLLAKKPDDRFQSASEVADLFARCQSEMQLTGKVTCVQSGHHAPRVEPAATASLPKNRSNAEHFRSPLPPPKGSSRGAMTATLGNTESVHGPDRRWWRYFTAGALIALVLFAAFMLNRHNNDQRTRLTSGDSHPSEVSIPPASDSPDRGKQGSSIEPTGSIASDRLAAEYVLSIGGEITIQENGPARQIAGVGDLPRGAFELRSVNLSDNQKVTDAGLAQFWDCRNLTSLSLYHAHKVSDAGLAHFRNCTNLTVVLLTATRVTNAGLAALKDCRNLKTLQLGETQVSDEGLSHFKDCRDLMVLGLNSTELTDAGLVHFRDCVNLTGLDLSSTDVSDVGLAHFRDFRNLTWLGLTRTQVSDAGLAHFRDCKNFTVLNLGHTNVSDDGLALFADCLNLGSVNVVSTRVTEAGVKSFSAALPECRIEWDGL